MHNLLGKIRKLHTVLLIPGPDVIIPSSRRTYFLPFASHFGQFSSVSSSWGGRYPDQEPSPSTNDGAVVQHGNADRQSDDIQSKFLAAVRAHDIVTCRKVLNEAFEQRSSRWVGRLVTNAIRTVPPNLGLQLYEIARRKDVKPTASIAVSVIRMYAALNMVRHIPGVVSEMIQAGLKPHWSVYFHWAAVNAEAAQPEGVSAAAQAAQSAGIELTDHYHTLMIKALCKSGKRGNTLLLLDEWRASGYVPPEPVWRALLHCHGQAGYVERTQAIFDEMRQAGIVPSVSTWTALLNAYAECGLLDEAINVAAAMKSAGLKGNTQFYTVLIKACMKGGDVAVARNALAQMQMDGLSPTIHIWGALISVCAAAGDTTAALDVFEEMKCSGCKPTVVQYTALLSAFRTKNDLKGGLKVLEDMKYDDIRATKQTYTEWMTLLGQNGRCVEALEAFQKMQKENIEPDKIAYNVIIGLLLCNWVDMDRRREDSPLLLRAEEIFQEGWAMGKTRPAVLSSSGNGKVIHFDLHHQGIWSSQLAVLTLLYTICVEREVGNPGSGLGKEELGLRVDDDFKHKLPAIVFITGRGVRSGWAPMRQAIWMLLCALGVCPKTSNTNNGLIILPDTEVSRVLDLHARAIYAQGARGAFWGHKYLIDPRNEDRLAITNSPVLAF